MEPRQAQAAAERWGGGPWRAGFLRFHLRSNALATLCVMLSPPSVNKGSNIGILLHRSYRKPLHEAWQRINVSACEPHECRHLAICGCAPGPSHDCADMIVQCLLPYTLSVWYLSPLLRCFLGTH